MADLFRTSVYVLCAATSAACAVMLFRGYLRSPRARFLLWSSLCFVALFANNLLLMIDRVVFPDRAVFPAALRSGVALVGLSLLVYGLVWDAE